MISIEEKKGGNWVKLFTLIFMATMSFLLLATTTIVAGTVIYDIITIPLMSSTVFPSLFPLNTGGIVGFVVGVVITIYLLRWC